MHRTQPPYLLLSADDTRTGGVSQVRLKKVAQPSDLILSIEQDLADIYDLLRGVETPDDPT